jgi:TPR repeat protein
MKALVLCLFKKGKRMKNQLIGNDKMLFSMRWAGFRGLDDGGVKEFISLAEQGDAEAQNNLGLMYGSGQGVERDYAEAVRWFKLAAEQGNAEAKNNLGGMFLKGKGVTNGIEDVEEAILWFKKSAEQGNVEAQCNLGLMFYEGKVVMQSNSEAMLWFKKAAEQGDATAQEVLKKLGW